MTQPINVVLFLGKCQHQISPAQFGIILHAITYPLQERGLPHAASSDNQDVGWSLLAKHFDQPLVDSLSRVKLR
jgi:hypothetical protein